MPTEPRDAATAKAWVGRYDELVEVLYILSATLRTYTSNQNDAVRANRLTKFIHVDGPAYLDLAPKVLDEGKQIGVKSCF